MIKKHQIPKLILTYAGLFFLLGKSEFLHAQDTGLVKQPYLFFSLSSTGKEMECFIRIYNDRLATGYSRRSSG